MNLFTLCETIGLQPEMKHRVFDFAEQFDFSTVKELQKGYLRYPKMSEALAQTQNVLGADPDGVKILACMLQAAADGYEMYQESGISDEIYFATMGCFPRFIEETYQMTGQFCFDRFWWTTRLAGGHLFRIGALEYEKKHLENRVVIGIHIPSDADFSPHAVENSLQEARQFFETRDASLHGVEYRCHSWLLDGQLREMLPPSSHIIQFQNRFQIFDAGEVGTDFLGWLYQTKSTDYHALPEHTSLQRQVKRHLLAGGVMRDAYGRLKDSP